MYGTVEHPVNMDVPTQHVQQENTITATAVDVAKCGYLNPGKTIILCIMRQQISNSDKMTDKNNIKVSNCCGEEDRLADINGPDWGDLGLCPRCKEHCDFVENDEGEGNAGT